VVNILLGALALVAGSEESAGRVREQAGLETGGLGVVVVTVSISLRNVLQDDPPVTLHVDSTGDLGIVHIAGAEVTLRPYPVGGIIRRGALAGTGVVLVVKGLLLRLGDVLH